MSYFVEKPWGHEIRWAVNDLYIGKILLIKENQRLSRQYHEIKDETIYVLNGKLIVEIGDPATMEGVVTYTLSEGESQRITPGTIHRFCAECGTDVELIEVSTPEIEDVVRLSDDYSRKTI